MTSAAISTNPERPSDIEGGEAIAAFVEGQIASEEERRTAIDGRGSRVVTSAAGLATLVFAATTLITARDAYVPPQLTNWAMGAAFLFFVAAGACGLMATQAHDADVVTAEQLETWRRSEAHWQAPKAAVRRLLTKANVRYLATLRAGNNTRMQWARIGFWIELGSLAPLAVAVGAILMHELYPSMPGPGGLLQPAAA